MLRFPGPGRSGPPTMGATVLWQPRRLLLVALQHLGASLRKLRPILLQAGQDGEVTLINDRAAEALDVAGTGFLFLVRTAPLLSESHGGERKRQQGESQEIFTHRVPSF